MLSAIQFRLRLNMSKNFKKEMGLTNPITLGGVLRRTARKYPLLAKVVKALLAVSVTSVFLYSSVPGSALPGQSSFKLCLIQTASSLSKFWNMNRYNPQADAYIIFLSEQFLRTLNHQIFRQDCLKEYFQTVSDLHREHKLQSSTLLMLAMYFDIILKEAVRYRKKWLLEDTLREGCVWLLSEGLKGVHVQKNVDKEGLQSIKMILSLFGFTLRYCKYEELQKVVDTYLWILSLAKKTDTSSKQKGKKEPLKPLQDQFLRSSLAYKLIQISLLDSSFKQTLKEYCILDKQSPITQKIFKIFEVMNEVHTCEEKLSVVATTVDMITVPKTSVSVPTSKTRPSKPNSTGSSTH